MLRECMYLPSEMVRILPAHLQVRSLHVASAATVLRCSGMAILRVTPVTFLYISHKPPLWSWTWLHHQKANKMTFPQYLVRTEILLTVHTRVKYISRQLAKQGLLPLASAAASLPSPYDWVRAHRQTDRHTKVKTVYPPVSLRSLGGYKNYYESEIRIFCLITFMSYQVSCCYVNGCGCLAQREGNVG